MENRWKWSDTRLRLIVASTAVTDTRLASQASIRNPLPLALFNLFVMTVLPKLTALALLTGFAYGDAVDFNRDVRPLLSNNCLHCHGPDATHREAKLRLDDERDAKRVRESGTVIVPGSLEKSVLAARVRTANPDEIMPPPESGKALKPSEIVLLERWIDEGATWSDHWAYVEPIRHPVLPGKVGAHWIDRFIEETLDREGLTFSPEADQVTLLRRVAFDLTGLPPDITAEAHPQAYERAVDRMLASPHFGERLAMYWLDLVRYADTVGYHGDQDHNITPYRDYVIDAFNENLPFDQFTREQLGGDLLDSPTIDQRVATGYNRLLQTSHEGGVQTKEYLAIYAADRVRNVSNVWMGATVGCAQCHDHKYDPYTSRDFYSLAAFFADIDEEQHFKVGTNELPTKRPPEIEVLSKRERLIPEWTKPRLTMVTQAVKPRESRVLPRGNWLDQTGEIVMPAVPGFMGSVVVEKDQRATRLDLADWFCDAERGKGKLTARVFANRFWYLLFGNGLARVLDDFGGQGEPPTHPELLDRLALEFIESGWDVKHLMRTMALSKSYRQDSLESEAIRARDPLNKFLSRQTRQRLPAEMIRDNALAVSELLVDTLGGASVKPYQPTGYYRHLNFPTRRYFENKDERQYRRGLYVHWQRQFLHPMLKAFDAPSREECTAVRPRSNTPTAALTLLNDPTFVEAARALAVRALRAGGEIDTVFQWVTGRAPDDTERVLLGDLLKEQQAAYSEHPDSAGELLAVGLVATPSDFPPSDLAAWTAVCRVLLNLNETITRN